MGDYYRTHPSYLVVLADAIPLQKEFGGALECLLLLGVSNYHNIGGQSKHTDVSAIILNARTFP